MTLVKHIFEALSFTGIAVFLLWCIVYACLHQALCDHIALHHDRVGLSDPLEGANCHFCGQTADNFHVSDGLWAKVAPALGKHQACFKCFRIAAWHVGLRPESAWEVTVG